MSGWRIKCANCGFVFDTEQPYYECVKCGSNACDEVEGVNDK